MPSGTPRLFLIDTFGLIFRAYYGRARSGAPLMRTSAGLPTEAVYIFNNMMRKLVETHRPEYLAAVWEGAGPTFRDEIFADYKANRDKTPDELLLQFPYLERLLESVRIPVLSCDGYEADDVIGTLATQAGGQDIDVYVISSDKDLTQLVNDHVYMLDPMKGDLLYDPDKVKELQGVAPSQIVDLLALKGDSVDNIPGAPGIGDKGARDLIAAYGGVEGAIENAAEVKRKTYRESLQQNREQILMSKELATIARDAPIELNLDSLRIADPNVEALADLYRELEFNSLLSQLDVPKAPVEVRYRTLQSIEEFEEWLQQRAPRDSRAPAAVVVELAGDELGTNHESRFTIHDSAVVVELPGDELDGGGVAFSVVPGEAVLLPASRLDDAKPYLEDASRPKRVHDLKSTIHQLESRGITPAGVTDDTVLAAFLLDASRSDYSLEKAIGRYLGVAADSDLCRTADLVRRLGETFDREIDALSLRDLYQDVELPLAPILARMESAGVLLDSAILSKLSQDMERKVIALSEEIHTLAGTAFNINSPKQLSKVLFEDLGLPAPARRGKTRALSTASDVLEGLVDRHEVIANILEYRRLMKLKGTYVDALPALIDAATGRLHTTFNQCGAATGRLSSANPNLQNIPIRTELGREIRAAFIARPGWTLLAADYSQIELRILAHISRDPVLVEAFRNGEDIHTRTAAEVFGVPPLMVGPEERRRAKAVNFGIVYGLSPFGLAKQLDIPQADARTYIDSYFERYGGVKKFMDKAVAEARRNGHTRTLLGRLRPIHDLDSRNPNVRGFAERTAINSPIQGSAADLIKLAMIRIDTKLREQRSDAVMLLQVHDELLFEVPEAEVAPLVEMVKDEMQQVYALDVPLVADVKVGPNWRDMKKP